MKSILLAVLGFRWQSPVWADDAAKARPTVGPETTLNTAAAFSRQHSLNALGFLTGGSGHRKPGRAIGTGSSPTCSS